jgi:ketosteroid isomerase-like protein
VVTTESVKLAAIPSDLVRNTPSTPNPPSSPQAAAGDALSHKATAANSKDTPLSAASSPSSTSSAIEQSLYAWAQAWSQKNIDEYFKAYAPEFDPPGRLSRADWEKERRERILPRAKIEVDLSQIHIEQRGQEATVRFVQHYRADAIKAASRKTLKLVKQQNRWLITEETVGG